MLQKLIVEMGVGHTKVLVTHEKAKKSNKPIATNLLNPHDRRIVHLALKDDENVDTKSRGEGILKKVVILPKK